MAKTFTPFGPEFQINVNSGGNNGISGAQDLASLAALSDGRFVVAYQSDYFGSATDTDPIVAIFNASGSTSLSYRDVYNAGALQKVPAVAARLDGGFGVVFQNDRHANNTVDANGPNITYVPVSAAGAVLSPIGVGDFNAGAGHDALQNPEIATLASGRQVVAFERVWTAGTDHDVFLNVVNAAGTATQFSIANPLDVQANASWQANPAVAAIGDVALVVYEDGTGTSTASANIRGRFFDGTSNTLGAAFTIADHAGRLRTADVAAIDDHRYAITYGDQNDVWVKVLDSTTGILSAEIQLDVTGGFSLNPQVSGAAGAGFVVTWAQYNGADYDVRARLFDGNVNAVGSDFIVTSLTNASQFTPDVTVSGTHVFFAWTDFAARPEDTAAPGIRGRMFSVSEPPNDFNGDARSDILWQNTDGTPAIWLLNGLNPIGVGVPGGSNPGPTWHVRDNGDFNGDGRADILWQNTDGTPSIWLMNGLNPIGVGVPGGSNPGPTWQIRATGDFNGDGNSDILWQNTNGTPSIWLMNGLNPIGADVPGGSNPGPTWQIRATGDFNGDGNSDILWQNTDGTPSIWLMNGLNPIGADVPGGSNPGPTWQIRATGDFNGDGNSDILWQNTDGTPSIWLMNGLNPIGADVPGGSNPGPTWHVRDAADFNGDGMADIAWQNDNGQAVIWLMNGTDPINQSLVGGNPGTDWHLL